MTKRRAKTLAKREPTGADAPGSFRAWIENIPGLVVITDAAGRILAFNWACERVTGYKRREVLGENLIELLVPPEERRMVRERFAPPASPELRRPHESHWLTKRGEPRLIEWRCAAFNWNAKSPAGVLGIGHEITERRWLEDALAQSRAKLKGIFDSSKDGIVYCTLDGMLLDVNAAYLRLTGYSRRELLGVRRYQDLTPPEYREFEARIVQRMQKTGRPVEYEKEYITKKGCRLPIMLAVSVVKGPDGRVAGIAAVVKNIKERKEIERELRFQARILHDVQHGVIVTAMDGKIVYWNRGAQRMFGYSARAMLGKPTNVLWLRDADFLRAGDLKKVAAGHDYGGDFQQRRKDGTIIWVQLKLTAMRDADGKAIGFVGINTDVTEQKRSEQTMKEYLARLQVLSRRLLEVQEAERRKISRDLHDEIGPALTGIKFALEAAARNCARTCRPDVEKAAKLVSGLFHNVRNISLDWRPPMLDDFGLLPALLALQGRLSGETSLRVELAHSGIGETRFPAEIETAAYRIAQEALTNVVQHAKAHRVTLHIQANTERLGIDLRDDGVGFDLAAVHARGTAQGLSGMRERARLLGGDVNIDSAPAKGTRITALLPLAARAAEQAATKR